jgi:hypothetical protein
MMFFLLSILLLASTTAAQLTTSIALGKYYFGTDKIGFYGSVVGVSNSYTTMTLDLDNGTRLFNSRSLPGIWTISPTSFGELQQRRRPKSILQLARIAARRTGLVYDFIRPERRAECALSER